MDDFRLRLAKALYFLASVFAIWTAVYVVQSFQSLSTARRFMGVYLASNNQDLAALDQVVQHDLAGAEMMVDGFIVLLIALALVSVGTIMWKSHNVAMRERDEVKR